MKSIPTRTREVNININIDWESIKTEYITTDISQKELAEKYGVSRKTLNYRCSVGQWNELRRRHRDSVIAKASALASDEAAARMHKLMGSADKLMDAALATLDDPDGFHRYLVKEREDGNTYTREAVFEKADTKAMKDMGTLLEKLTGLTRDLYGLPTREQELREQLAAERLALAKQQAESGTAQRIEVVFAEDSGYAE